MIVGPDGDEGAAPSPTPTRVLALALAVTAAVVGCAGREPTVRVAPRVQRVAGENVRLHDALEACSRAGRAPRLHGLTRRVGTARARTGPGRTAHLRVELERRLSRSFELVDVALALDDRCIRRVTWETDARDTDPDLRAVPPVEGAFAAGPHRLRAYVVLRSRASPYGIFSMSYRAYRFTLRTIHDFVLSAGERATMHVVVHERGTVTTPIEERPAIEIRWSSR